MSSPLTIQAPINSQSPISKDTMISTGVLLFLIPICIMAYHGVRYYKMRNHPALKQRYPVITVFESFITIINFISSFCYLYEFDYKYTERGSYVFVYALFWDLSKSILTSCWVWRFYLLDKQIKCNKAIVDKWIYIINSNDGQIQQYPEITELNTWSNSSWTRNRILIPWNAGWFLITLLFLISFDFYYSIKYQPGSDYFSAIMAIIWVLGNHMISFVFLVYIYMKMPPIETDIYFVKDELKNIFRLLAITPFLLILSVLSIFVIPSPYNAMVHFYSNIVIELCKFGAVIFATYWVRWKIRDIPDINRISTELQPLNQSPVHKDELIEIFNDERKFNTFLVYTSQQEMCTDSVLLILAFIEIIQFQQHLNKFRYHDEEKVAESESIKSTASKPLISPNMDDNDDNIQQSLYKDLFKDIIFCDEIPESEIVTEDKDEKDLNDDMKIKRKADKLFDKYLRYDSLFDIESLGSLGLYDDVIPLLMSNKSECNDTLNIDGIIKAFDKCAQVIFEKLLQVFRRFKLQNQPSYNNYNTI